MSRNTQEACLELYEPHDMQQRLHDSNARYRVAAFGRQSGKSTWGINELLAKAWENPKTKYWFISPIFSQAEVQFERMIDMVEDCGAAKSINRSKKEITLINKSTITFKSGETFQRLRGSTLNGVIIDEVREQHPDLWPLVIRAMLTTTRGWAAFISTPNGFDQFYDFFERGRNDKTGRWECFQAPSTCNPLFSQEEFEEAKAESTEGVFAQEILAEFREIQSGRAYCNYGNHNDRLTSPFTSNENLISPYMPIAVALDFNISPMSWTLGQVSGKEAYWFDEIHLENSNTQEASKELIERVKGHKPGVILIGDSSGKARQRAAASKSDYDIVCQALDDAEIIWQNLTPDSNPAIKDRVNTVNTRCKSGDGTVTMWLHPERCPYLKKDLLRVLWKKSSGSTTVSLDAGKKNELTHQSDGVGYYVCVMLPIYKVPEVGKMRIIRR